MRLYNINGKLIYKNVRPFLIEWDANSKSKFQFEVKQFLKKYWFAHIVYEEFPVYGSLLKVDFLNATTKVAVEVNGPHHEGYHAFFHAGSKLKYLFNIKRDQAKAAWLERNSFKLIEIYSKDLPITKEWFEKKFEVFL